MCWAKSDELPVTLLHVFYVESSLNKCFIMFIAEGYLMNVGFCQIELKGHSNYQSVQVTFRKGVHILV